MQRVDIHIPAELLARGEAVDVFGPDAAGDLDTSVAIGRVTPIRGERSAAGLASNAPSGAAIRGREEAMGFVRSKPLGSGVHEFAFGTRNGETGEATVGTSPAASVFLETGPAEAVNLTSEESLSGGKLRFLFSRRSY